MAQRRKVNKAPIMIDRDTAANTGKTRFYTGRPCKHGHLAERFTSSGACVECVNRVTRVCGTGEEWWMARVAIPAPVTSEHRNELQRLIEAWAAIKLREWGYLPEPTAAIVAGKWVDLKA